MCVFTAAGKLSNIGKPRSPGLSYDKEINDLSVIIRPCF